MSGIPFTTNPSDSGLLEGSVVPSHVSGSPMSPDVPPKPRQAATPTEPVDGDVPEQSLGDVPLPEGFLTRLRRFVDEL